jgi:hypothetical protein
MSSPQTTTIDSESVLRVSRLIVKFRYFLQVLKYVSFSRLILETTFQFSIIN